MTLNASVSKQGVDWSGIGSTIGGIGSAIGGIASLFGHSGGVSVYKSNQIQKFQERMQEKYLQNYYSNARDSLNRAGYNPMLAYVNTPSGGATNAVATEGNEVGQRAQAFANIIQQKIAEAQVKNTNANTVKQLEQVNTEKTIQRLNTAMALATNTKLPYEVRELASRNIRNILEGESAVTNANASMKNALVNEMWRPYEARTMRNRKSVNAFSAGYSWSHK